jgi:hypothetical protein
MRTLVLSLLTLAGTSLMAEDFRALAKVTQSTWTAAPSLAVACNYANSRETVERLADAFDRKCHIAVVDIRHPDQVGRAQNALIRFRPDLMVLLPGDTSVADGSYLATVLVNGLARAGISSAGTTRMALKQGARFAVGEGTGGELLISQKWIELIGPVEGVPMTTGALLGPASLGQADPIHVITLK